MLYGNSFVSKKHWSVNETGLHRKWAFVVGQKHIKYFMRQYSYTLKVWRDHW